MENNKRIAEHPAYVFWDNQRKEREATDRFCKQLKVSFCFAVKVSDSDFDSCVLELSADSQFLRVSPPRLSGIKA